MREQNFVFPQSPTVPLFPPLFLLLGNGNGNQLGLNACREWEWQPAGAQCVQGMGMDSQLILNEFPSSPEYASVYKYVSPQKKT